MIIHADLFVSSMERSLAFYRRLGCVVVDDSTVTGPLPSHVSGGRHREMRIVLLRVSAIGSQLELLELLESSDLPAAPAREWPPHAGALSFWLEDLEDRIAALTAAGLAPTWRVASAELPGIGPVSIASYEDPDGHRIHLVGRSPSDPITPRAHDHATH